MSRLTLTWAPPEAPGEGVTELSWPIFCSGPQIRPAPQPTPPHPPLDPLSLPTAPPPHPPPPAAQRALRPTWAAGTTDAPLVLCWCRGAVLASCTGSGCSQRLAGGQVVEGCCCCCGRCRHPTPAPPGATASRYEEARNRPSVCWWVPYDAYRPPGPFGPLCTTPATHPAQIATRARQF